MSNLRIEKFKIGVFDTNCYFVYNDETKELVIVDPGKYEESLIAYIKESNLKPVAILLTHGHFDHISGVSAFQDLYSEIKTYACSYEQELIENPEYNLSSSMGSHNIILDNITYLNDGDEILLIGFKFKLIWTPGHTRGSVCYYIEDEKILFSGDLLFYHTVGRTDLPTSNNSDLIDSLKLKIKPLPDDVKVFPGHGSYTSVGEEMKYNF